MLFPEAAEHVDTFAKWFANTDEPRYQAALLDIGTAFAAAAIAMNFVRHSITKNKERFK